jgi:hypothetical protein
MIVIVILAAAFLAAAGVLVLLRIGIAREESEECLLDEPPTRTAAVTRRVVGLYVRMPEQVIQPDEAADPTDPGQGQRPPTARPGR